MFGGVVFAGDERPFKEDVPVAPFGVIAASIHQFGQVPSFGGGDEGLPFSVGGAVQADGEADALPFIGEADDAGDDADGAEGDVAGGEGEAFVVGEDVYGRERVVVVVQGFAHTHEDDVAQAFATCLQEAVYEEGLGDDFAGGEVTLEAHLAGGAEDAAHGAAGLGADAGGGAAFEFHEDGFDGFAIGEGEEEFAGEAVAAVGAGVDGEGVEYGRSGQSLGQIGAQVRHFCDGGCLFLVQVMPDLGGMVTGVAPLGHQGSQLRQGIIVQVDTWFHGGGL